MIIKSQSNSTYKLLSKLINSAKDRRKEQLYVIEGINIVKQAIYSEAPIESIIISEDFNLKEAFSSDSITEYKVFSKQRFDELSDTVNSQGIMCIVAMSEANINSYEKNLVIDKVQDPGNLGAIIRSADAFGVDNIFITKGSCDVYNPKVVRSTMGSIFHLNIIKDLSNIDIYNILSENNVKTYAALLDIKARHINNITTERKWALILGNESKGIDDFWKNKASYKVMIPMLGKAESLNVAIAGSIILYQFTCHQ